MGVQAKLKVFSDDNHRSDVEHTPVFEDLSHKLRSRPSWWPYFACGCGLVLLCMLWLGQASPPHNGPRRRTGVHVPDRLRCDVLDLPEWRGRLQFIRRLDLADCGLTHVPDSIGLAASLQFLDLGRNPLTELPASLARCHNLHTLFVSGAPGLVEFPPVLGRMPGLTRLGLKSNGIRVVKPESVPSNVEHLILTNNRIAALDVAVFSRLRNVRKLMLASNELVSLPSEGVAMMQSLELIRLSNNQLQHVPGGLLQLPRLAWLSLAGNPFMPPPPPPAVPQLSTLDVSANPAQLLGEGASGLVRPGVYRGQAVAVKQFKAASSDGRPENELAIYAAIRHPSFVRVFGVMLQPPAVVMELLPRSLHNIGQPPTINEVIEDRYSEDAFETFSLGDALTVLEAVASALAHLHSPEVRVQHGDVYSHNTLSDAFNGHAVTTVRLVDFGAAFSYGQGAEADDVGLDPALLQRVEVRAFGVMAHELLGLTTKAEAEHVGWFRRTATMFNLMRLVRACLKEDVAARPAFRDIASQLAATRSSLVPADTAS